jgi:hypothetical protein
MTRHLNFFFLALACLNLMACGSQVPEVKGLKPIIQVIPVPTPPVETPEPVVLPAPTIPNPDLGPIPEPMLDFSSSVNTQTKPDSRIPGTWSTVGRVLNPVNAGRAMQLLDGRVIFIDYGFMETRWTGNATVPVKRHLGSGEVFNPVTGQAVPFKDLNYNSSFQLKDGRILFFHPERTSVFDPQDNSFTHFKGAPFPLVSETVPLQELGGGLIYFDGANRQHFRYDLQAGRLLESTYPVTKALVENTRVQPGWSFSVNVVFFEDTDRALWEIRPDFVAKADYSIEEVVAGDWFFLSKLNQKLERTSEVRLKLPLDVRSAGFFNKNTLMVERYLYNTSGASSGCSRVFFDLVTKSQLSVFEDGCGRYTGYRSSLQTGPNEILYFNPTIYPGDTGPDMRSFAVDGSKEELQLKLIHAQYVAAAFKLKNGKFVFMGGNRCAGRFGTGCFAGSDGPRDWMEIYNPISHVFQLAADPQQIRFQARMVQGSDGRILMAGGVKEIRKSGPYNFRESTFETVDSIEIYTPEN